jgi:hypothetical protein
VVVGPCTQVEEDQGLGRVEALDELVKDFVASDNKDAIVKSVADKVRVWYVCVCVPVCAGVWLTKCVYHPLQK